MSLSVRLPLLGLQISTSDIQKIDYNPANKTGSIVLWKAEGNYIFETVLEVSIETADEIDTFVKTFLNTCAKFSVLRIRPGSLGVNIEPTQSTSVFWALENSQNAEVCVRIVRLILPDVTVNVTEAQEGTIVHLSYQGEKSKEACIARIEHIFAVFRASFVDSGLELALSRLNDRHFPPVHLEESAKSCELQENEEWDWSPSEFIDYISTHARFVRKAGAWFERFDFSGVALPPGKIREENIQEWLDNPVDQDEAQLSAWKSSIFTMFNKGLKAPDLYVMGPLLPYLFICSEAERSFEKSKMAEAIKDYVKNHHWGATVVLSSLMLVIEELENSKEVKIPTPRQRVIMSLI
jgi:hypothetical protein